MIREPQEKSEEVRPRRVARARLRSMISSLRLRLVALVALMKARRVVIGLSLVALFAQLGWMALNFSALPVWMQYKLKMGASLGLVMGAFMLTEAVFRPTFGALGDRIGRRPLMLAGPAISIFTAFGTLATLKTVHIVWHVNAFNHSFAISAAVVIMIVLRAIDGVGLAAFWPAAFAAFGDAVEEKYRTTAMSIMNFTQMGAIALGMLLAGIANDYLSRWLPSYTGAFYFCSLVFLLTVVVGFLMLPKRIGDHHHHDPNIEEAHIPHKEEIEGAFKMVPDMIVLSVVVFAAIGILMPIVKLYAMDALGMNETRFGQLVLPVAILLGAVALPFGWLADKWGKMVSVCYGMLVCAGAMWIIATFRSVLALALASAVLGVGFELAFPAWMAVVSQAAPRERRGQVMGAVGLAQGMGALLGVLVAPRIYNNDWLSLPRLGINHMTLPFYLCAVMLSIGTVMTFTWISRKRAAQAGGRQITDNERRSVLAISIVGLVLLMGWIVVRYTSPVQPDRVAWMWVQAAAKERNSHPERYTLRQFEEDCAAGMGQSRSVSRVYRKWINEEEARYRTTRVRYYDSGKRAVVTMRFVFPEPQARVRYEEITLRKQPDGEWKVSGRCAMKK